MVQTAAALKAYRSDVAPRLAAADIEALDRIQQNWALSIAPESGPAYKRPSLIVCGRQDSVTGFEDQYALAPATRARRTPCSTSPATTSRSNCLPLSSASGCNAWQKR